MGGGVCLLCRRAGIFEGVRRVVEGGKCLKSLEW